MPEMPCPLMHPAQVCRVPAVGQALCWALWAASTLGGLVVCGAKETTKPVVFLVGVLGLLLN